MEMAVETAEKAARAQPLILPPSWLLGSPPPWRCDPWGRQNMASDPSRTRVQDYGGVGAFRGIVLGYLGFFRSVE